MPALSPTLVSILDGAMRLGATHAEIAGDRGVVRLLRGSEQLATGPLATGDYDKLVAELRIMSAASPDEKLTVQSPAGPLRFAVTFAATSITLVLRDEDEAARETAFSELMDRVFAIGATSVTCTKEEAVFSRGDEPLESIPLVPEAIALLVAHGRALGDQAVLFGGGTARTIRVELAGEGVRFTVV